MKVKGLMFKLKGEDHAYFPVESLEMISLTADILQGIEVLVVWGGTNFFKDIEFDVVEIRGEDDEVLDVTFINPIWIADDGFKWEVVFF